MDVVALGLANTRTDKVKHLATGPNTVVLFGDSITERNSLTSGTLVSNDARGYFTWANILLGQRLRLLRNAGVSGNKTADLLARIQTDVIAYNPGWCVVQVGTNDVTNSVATATIEANLTTIYQTLLRAGIKVIATTITPYNFDTSAMNIARNAVNRWIREYVLSTPGMVLVDWAVSVVDTTQEATSYWIPTYTGAGGSTSEDGLHPATLGAARLGWAMYQALDPVVPPFSNLPEYNSDPGNILPNGMLAFDSAGLATSPAGAWTLAVNSGSASPSKVARTDLIGGDWQQVAIGPGGDANVRMAWDTGFSVGDQVYGEVEFQTDPFVSATRFECSVLALDSGFATLKEARDLSMNVTETWPLESQPRAGVFRTPTITLPTGTVHMRFYVRLAGQGVFRIARAQVRKAGL